MSTLLYDKDFLLKLDKDRNKTIYARITSLQFNESPVETIEGRVTQGSINIDGTSAVRRSCSLSIVAQDFDYNDYYWGLKTKFKLEVGVENNIDSSYPKIIWFPQGIYLITSFNTSRTSNNFTISINGKDKMCLLNGEIGGTLEASIDFGTIEEEDKNGVWQIRKIPIAEIIRNAVHTYAGEPYWNIVINDLDTYGLELLEYRYDTPMYFYRSKNDDENIYHNILIENDNLLVYPWDEKTGKYSTKSCTLKDLKSTHLDLLVDSLTADMRDALPVKVAGKEYIFSKIEYGQTAGYRTTELIYPGDLIANVGDSITSVLDKIKNMLTEFEYFYDIDGRFVFQKKQSFISTMWAPAGENDRGDQAVMNGLMQSSTTAYTFSGGELITAFNNNPNLLNLRNDYSIWGERKGVSGASIPVHMRYAIDKKPIRYKNFDGKIYMTDRAMVEALKQQEKDRIKNEFFSKVNGFKMAYPIPEGLSAPIRKADGSWSAGWWDIRDWYVYYTILNGEPPRYTMKWYSSNDLQGCVKAKSLPIEYDRTMTDNQYVWLLIRKANGQYNPQHGSGNPHSGTEINCTLYHSYYTNEEQTEFVTERVLDENGKYITKKFIQPYSGCSNDHTYLEFLENDVKKDGNTVYFYHPAFPAYDSYEDLVSDQIDKEYEEYEKQGLLNYVDWREVIYQMALDYYKYNTLDEFESRLIEANPIDYPTGQTGYENYYIDLQGFWRQLYNPDLNWLIGKLAPEVSAREEALIKKMDSIELLEKEIVALNEKKQNQTITTDEAKALYEKREELLWLKKEYDFYFAETANKKDKLQKYTDDLPNYYYFDGDGTTYTDYRQYWNRNVYEHPEVLNFWFDFLDAQGELEQFNVKTLGFRSKALNDTSVKSIYFRNTPAAIFTNDINSDKQKLNAGYKYIQIPEDIVSTMFSISAQGKSAKDKLDELLYQHGYCVESATITAIPIYYLEPNTRIHLYDKDTNLDGDYIASKITLPLAYNGTMSITATKAAENLY